MRLRCDSASVPRHAQGSAAHESECMCRTCAGSDAGVSRSSNKAVTTETCNDSHATDKVKQYTEVVLTNHEDDTTGKVIRARLTNNDITGENEWRLSIQWDCDPDDITESWESSIQSALRKQNSGIDPSVTYTRLTQPMSVARLARLWKLPPWVVVQWLHKFDNEMFATVQLPKRGVKPKEFRIGTEVPCPLGHPELPTLFERYNEFRSQRQSKSRSTLRASALHIRALQAGCQSKTVTCAQRAKTWMGEKWTQLLTNMGIDDDTYAVYVESLAPGVRPKHVNVGNCKFTLANLCKLATKNKLHEPTSVREALEGPDRRPWLDAIAKEVNSIRSFGTYELVKREDIPTGALIMGLKEILKVKTDESGKLDKLKFRITVQGYSQDFDKGDYKQAFSPTVAYATIKCIVALAALEGLNLSTMDYSCAFLQGDEIDVPNQLYVKLEGSTLEQKDPVTGEQLLGRITGSWYGLKSAPALWQGTQVRYITAEATYRWKQGSTDQCLFMHEWTRTCTPSNRCHNCKCRDATTRDLGTKQNQHPCLKGTTGIIRMCTFVDDSLFAWEPCDREHFHSVKNELLNRFKGTFQEEAPGIVGMRFSHNQDGSVTMDQEAFIDVALRRFNREDTKTKPVPIRPEGIHAEAPADKETLPTDKKHYLSLVSTIAYAQHTHPEITYTCNRLQRFMHDPKAHHTTAAYQCLDYLHGVKNKGITYGKQRNTMSQAQGIHSDNLVCYVDADLPDAVARNQTLMQAIRAEYTRPTTGVVVTLAGAAIHCSSNTQPTVVASTAEAEATALHQGAKFLTIYKNLLEELKYRQPTSPPIVGDDRFNVQDIPLVANVATILGDNRSALLEFSNVGRGSRLKHMRLKLASNQQAVKNGEYIPFHVKTAEQLADICTKAFVTGGESQFHKLRDALRGDIKWTLDLSQIVPRLDNPQQSQSD